MSSQDSRMFACPKCKRAFGDDSYECAPCALIYPSVKGVPVLLNESNSLFSIESYLLPETSYGGASDYGGHLDTSGGPQRLYRRFVTYLSEAPLPVREFTPQAAVDEILKQRPNARILAIGAGDAQFSGNVTYTDVALGRHVSCIADAHDLPFASESFDACIAVAVLEHVLDPYRCVQEITRVLKADGLVYAETPFMQPVHMGAYDFTRFTRLGHRRLFRYFEEIRSGVVGGAGVSAAQMLRYTLAAMSDRPGIRKWLKLVGLIATFPLRWLDYLSHGHQAAYDCASAFYFFGRRSDEPLSDQDLIRGFRGGG